jgi:predicted signal transduction protein with EAL and GGDEF domain
VFEITETAAMSEIDVTLAFIRRLKHMGCRFALDDFGAGFSSFYYLKRFDVDYLKIDGSFIHDLSTDDGSRIFVKALNNVARDLDKQVVAEWVETPEALKILLEMGAQFGQGYLFQRPAPLEASIVPVVADVNAAVGCATLRGYGSQPAARSSEPHSSFAAKRPDNRLHVGNPAASHLLSPAAGAESIPPGTRSPPARAQPGSGPPL